MREEAPPMILLQLRRRSFRRLLPRKHILAREVIDISRASHKYRLKDGRDPTKINQIVDNRAKKKVQVKQNQTEFFGNKKVLHFKLRNKQWKTKKIIVDRF
jgi:hypothetical protein